MIMKKYFVYYVEMSIWGAYRPARYFFKKRENAVAFANSHEYTTKAYAMKVTASDYSQMTFED